jgi:lipopolysaccharide export system protein LptA
MKNPLTYAVLLLLALPASALAQQQASTPSNPNASKPIVITAQQTMEWHRNDNQYIARGQVIAIQGDSKIESDTLIADYRQDAKSNNDIYQLTAIDNVRLSDQDSTAYGDHAVYDIDKGLGILTGKNLHLVMPSQIVTCKDRFEYWSDQGRANAIGHAHAIQGIDTIDADMLSAFFVQPPVGSTPAPKAKGAQTPNSQTGGRQLDRLEAWGHVVITTPTEVLTGDRGVYHKTTNIADIYDHVTIKRGPNVLEGDWADIDMNTNISRMHAKPGGKRVRGVFYPGTQNGTPGAAATVKAKPKSAAPVPPAWNTAIVQTPAAPAPANPPGPSPSTLPQPQPAAPSPDTVQPAAPKADAGKTDTVKAETPAPVAEPSSGAADATSGSTNETVYKDR